MPIIFYGKMNTFNSIYFFDFGVGLGAGQYKTRSNWETFQDTTLTTVYNKESNLGFNLKSFFKIYLSPHVNFGLEYDYSGVKGIVNVQKKEEIIYFTDLMLSVGFLF